MLEFEFDVSGVAVQGYDDKDTKEKFITVSFFDKSTPEQIKGILRFHPEILRGLMTDLKKHTTEGQNLFLEDNPAK